VILEKLIFGQKSQFTLYLGRNQWCRYYAPSQLHLFLLVVMEMEGYLGLLLQENNLTQ
jgi:hypothetical protein